MVVVVLVAVVMGSKHQEAVVNFVHRVVFGCVLCEFQT